MTTLTTISELPDLASCTREELLAHAREMGIRGISQLKKQDILRRITDAQHAILEAQDAAQIETQLETQQEARPAARAETLETTRQEAPQELQRERQRKTRRSAQTDLQFEPQPEQQAVERTDLTGGILEVVDDSYGFLRGESLLPAPTDVYVPQPHIRAHDLRSGDYVIGSFRAPKSKEKYYALRDVVLVNGEEPEQARQRARFEELTAVFPHQKFLLETDDPTELSGRVIDLVAPMGRGQRGLIVSPPKAGKTMLLQSIANGIATNHPDVHLMVVLIGERPEEVTEMKRSVRGEVVASTFDEPVEDHTRVAELGMERAKRLMEMGRDVVILLDSITRLTRAYNLEMPSTGRTLSGGIDPVALYPPKRFFGSARKAEEGGSMTIIATCLVDTGSRLDDVVFEEFKGTGNWEVRLDRKLAERRIYPSIDIAASSTRREELLLTGEELQRVWLLRRMMSVLAGSGGNSTEPTERLLDRLARTKSNSEFLENLTAAEA